MKLQIAGVILGGIINIIATSFGYKILGLIILGGSIYMIKKKR